VLLSAAAALVSLLACASPVIAAEILYWNNEQSGEIETANIDGSGGGPLNLGSVKLSAPEGMAIDTAANRLYVASEGKTRSSTSTSTAAAPACCRPLV
jgi:hypothetical protein